ncbi:Uncharacterized protein FWK35_00007689 [Aphis craccivora]|uniref:Uncharacterized protein n=1 Tax=Aphis craccivora TaxID=307492 RepID=A0A6G0Z0N2_APHCR|nr:Uncharacterized protein FWK35_00007689 [Aphis craccivora]
MELIKTPQSVRVNIDKPTFLTLNNGQVHEGNDNLIGAAKRNHHTYATPSHIYSEIFANNCTTNVLAELPREDYSKRSIRGNRLHNDPAKSKIINGITKEGTWNVHDTTLHGSHRTNNPTEGWNNRFAHLVGQKHPTI